MPNLSPTDKLIRYHIWVSGKVRGVGYRYSLLQAANKLHLKGRVRNLPDGRVQAVFEGNPQDTEAFASLLSSRKSPSGSYGDCHQRRNARKHPKLRDSPLVQY